MTYQSKTAVSIGTSGKHAFPMNPLHLTTGKFMHFEVAFAKEFAPMTSDKTINHKSFVRCMPMKKPLLSAVSFHKSAYFVPFRTVWEPFTDFKEDSPHVQQDGAAILNHVPLLSNQVVVEFILSDSTEVLNWSPSNTHEYDFLVTGADNAVHAYKMGPKARDCFKLLRSLGYGVYFRDYHPLDPLYNRTQSALPLLCVAKVYLDYFFPNQYSHTGYYINLDGIFNRQYEYTLSSQDFVSIMKVCRFVSYSDDYFVSAFDSPLGPSAGVSSTNYRLFDLSELNLGYDQNSITDLSVENSMFNNGTPYVFMKEPRFSLTQEMDSKLKALTNYIRRHGLAGSRSLERYLADYGVALDADKLKRCYKLGEKHYPLQVSDIMSTADTIHQVADEVTGAALGDYAGSGVAFNGDFNFQLDIKEFGYLFVINTIVPEVSYFQGIDRNVLHKTRLDFFTGDFDGLSTRPISSEELFVGTKLASDSYDSIFGFTPMYSEYKCCPDRVSGDFLLSSMNVGLEGFSTVREFVDQYENNDDKFDVVHSFNFVLGEDWEQFNRIFADSNNDSDKFVIVHRCNMKPYIPAKPLYDFYDFEDDKEKVTLDVNGVKSN